MSSVKSFDLPPFRGVEICSGLNAVVVQGPSQTVQVESDQPNVLRRVEVRVLDGCLRARYIGNLFAFLPGGGIIGSRAARSATVRISLPELTAIAAATSAQVRLEGFEGSRLDASAATNSTLAVVWGKADDLSLKSSSNARITASGTCDRLVLRFRSGSRISAMELACTDLEVDGSNGSFAEATVLGSAVGSIRNGATLFIGGRPQTVEVTATGGCHLVLA